MGKNLVIVESPAKAKTISRFLGPTYRVEPSYGHVRDLPQSAKEVPKELRKKDWAKYGVNIDDGFEPVYVVPADKKEHVKRLRAAAKEAEALLLATDEDREGESISWHVLQLLKPKKSLDVQRIVFHEVTPEAIEAALASPREVDENLVRAQEARRVVDRLFGYSLSRYLWQRVAPRLSAGRVQSVAVRLLVERERARIAFVSASYWDLSAELGTEAGAFKTKLQRIDGRRLASGKSFDPDTGELRDKERVHLDEERSEKLAAALAGAVPWVVSSLESKPGSQKPAAPFITSTLQQEANRKLRMTSRQTMRVAQRLYEGIDLEGERVGLITYMRTDSVTLAERAVEQTRQMIAETYGEDYLPGSPVQYKTKAKRAQEAHEAIRPTDLTRRPQDLESFLDRDELRLYELIWKRTVACQMVPARFERTSVEVQIDHDGESFFFTASGRRIVFPGFLRAYVEGADDPEAELGDQETHLPELRQGQELAAKQVSAEGHTTKAPYRFTEASLVKKLEEEGIGRPSTYASIIGTIQDRDYAFKRGNELVPTFTAFCVTDLLEQQFRDLVDTHFTARMEDELDSVADGTAAWDALVSDFFIGDEGAPGLQPRLADSEMIYPAIEVGKDGKTDEKIVVKIGPKGNPYLRRGEGEKSLTASVPEDIAPDELTLEKAIELLRSREGEAPQVGIDGATGRPIRLKSGRFGPYLEVEQSEEEKEAGTKPRRTSLPRQMKPQDMTEEIATKLILLPRIVGVDPADGEEISTAIGKFGPYVKKGKDFRSLGSWEEACDIELSKALEILAQPKTRGRQQKKIIKELGEIEGAPGPVNVLEGRYGPYVTDGETNASLPRGTDPESVTPEMALELLEKRRNAPKKPRRRRKRS